MFTSGQLIFALIAIIIFAIVIIFSYRGDKKLHKKYYRGNIWVLIGFLIFIGFLILLKTYLKN
ncbi:hypothetical protein EI546_04190 [Aequorivita sp. H23M31]|uniref:Uncharacterized protein n=1 Tax=Aequorivita ciconiae TaxID=2494375 RepID=A0A410G129_9FLAO|nr:hypothetical protein EI546_04190 [Aequorivita sp. H23M31]